MELDGFKVSYLDDDLTQRDSRDTFAEVTDTFRLEQPFVNPE